MSNTRVFHFSIPVRPEGEPIEGGDLERKLRARVAAHPAGSRGHRAAVWQVARFLSVIGRQREAIVLLEELYGSTNDAEERAAITLAVGQMLEQIGDFANAAEAYSHGVALEPTGAPTWYFLHNNLGYSLNQLGRFAAAEGWCRAAIAIDPSRYNAHKNLGLACEGQGRFGEAARALIEACHCEAAEPRALQHLDDLVTAHPEVLEETPGLEAEIEDCIRAFNAANLVIEAEMEDPDR